MAALQDMTFGSKLCSPLFVELVKWLTSQLTVPCGLSEEVSGNLFLSFLHPFPHPTYHHYQNLFSLSLSILFQSSHSLIFHYFHSFCLKRLEEKKNMM